MGLERSLLHEKVANEERQRRLERFHAPNVRRLMQKKPPLASAGLLETLPATIMFCDLSGFTSYCENHSPEMVGKL